MAFASMPLSYKRLYNGPLDEDSKFESIELAEEYAKGPTSYPGQVIGVKVDNNNWKSYTINENKTISAAASIEDMVNMFSWEEL